MREKLIEAEGVKFARARGWSTYKWASPGMRGVHDQIHFKGHVTFTLEYKTTGKKATPMQKKVAEDLKSKGIPCRCCDTVQKAREFIENMTRVADLNLGTDFIEPITQDISSFDP